MKNRFILMGTAAAATLGVAGPAAADVTADQIWNSWVEHSQAVGQTLSAASASMDGAVLTLDGVTFVTKTPEGQVTGAIDQVTMTEVDGTVVIVNSDVYNLSFDGPNGTIGSIVINTPGFGTIASGGDGVISYDYSGGLIDVSLASAMVKDTVVPVVFGLTIEDVVGAYTMSGGGDGAFESAMSAAGMSLRFDAANPDNKSERLSVTAEYSDIATESSGVAADMAAMSDPMALTAGDIALAVSFRHGGGGYSVDANIPDAVFALSVASDGGAIEFAIDQGGAGYSMENTAIAATFSGEMIPLPEVSLELDELAFAVSAPVAASDEASDFGVMLNVDGLAVSDMLWSMVDRGGVLPHDPATFFVEVNGAARLMADLADAAVRGGPPPVAFEALNLSGLTVALAGAEITGEGGFDFSGAPEGALPGMPGVAGTLALSIRGVNGLIDNLIAMGIAPPEQANMGRMMLGAFARPVGEDHLETEIVMGADGTVTANGQPLPF